MVTREYKGMQLIGEGPYCFRCGNSMKPKSIRLGGISVRAWRCPKDGEVILHPDDAELALMLNKLRRQGVKVKIGTLNKAPYIRFPKEFSRILVKGDEVVVKVISAKAFTLDVIRHDGH